MFERLGTIAERRFVWIIISWLALAGIVKVVAPSLRSVVTSDVTAFLTADAQSVEASRLLAEHWPEDDFGNSMAITVGRDPALTPADRTYIDELEAWARSDRAPEEVAGTISARSRPD